MCLLKREWNMKDFKKYLFQTLLQLTILLNVYRYPTSLRNTRSTTIDLIDHQLLLNNKQEFNSYLNEIILNQQEIYLYPLQFQSRQEQTTATTRKIILSKNIIEHPTLQTVASLVNYRNNANLTQENMTTIEDLLFEQDIDIGIPRVNLFGTNNDKYNNDYLFNTTTTTTTNIIEQQKNDDINIAIKLFENEIPDGYKIIVEEDTGERLLIALNETNNLTTISNRTYIQQQSLILFDNINNNNNNNSIVPNLNYSNETVSNNLLLFNNLTFNNNNNNSIDGDLQLIDLNDLTPKINDSWVEKILDDLPIDDNNVGINLMQEININNNHTNGDDEFINNALRYYDNNNDDTLLNEFNNNDFIYQLDNLINDLDKQQGDIQQQQQDLIKYEDVKFIKQEEIEEVEDEVDNDDDDDDEEEGDEYGYEYDFDDKHSLTSSTFGNREINENAVFGLNHNHTYLETVSTLDHAQNHPHSFKNKKRNMQNMSLKRSKDEKLINDLKIPYTLEEIVQSTVDSYNEILKNSSLTQEQLNVIKDIRRRGKNKVAAQICRKRKIESIDHLRSQVEKLRQQKSLLLKERLSIRNEIKNYALRVNQIYTQQQQQQSSNQLQTNDTLNHYVNNLMLQIQKIDDGENINNNKQQQKFNSKSNESSSSIKKFKRS